MAAGALPDLRYVFARRVEIGEVSQPFEQRPEHFVLRTGRASGGLDQPVGVGFGRALGFAASDAHSAAPFAALARKAAAVSPSLTGCTTFGSVIRGNTNLLRQNTHLTLFGGWRWASLVCHCPEKASVFILTDRSRISICRGRLARSYRRRVGRVFGCAAK